MTQQLSSTQELIAKLKQKHWVDLTHTLAQLVRDFHHSSPQNLKQFSLMQMAFSLKNIHLLDNMVHTLIRQFTFTRMMIAMSRI